MKNSRSMHPLAALALTFILLVSGLTLLQVEISVPQVQRVVPGLIQRVEVLRDRWGVPHIYAQNSSDLFLAQGYITAADRLFQLDMWRRTGTGKLAEVLGP